MQVMPVAFAVLLGVTEVAVAHTYYVNPDGTGDAISIQDGINIAAIGDTV